MEHKLIEVTEDNLKLLYDLRTNPSIDKYLTGPMPTSYDAHVKYIKDKGRSPVLRILHVEGVGNVGYGQIKHILKDRDDGKYCEVGFVIAPEHQGKGYGRALVDAISTLAISEPLSFNVVSLLVKETNKKAIALYKKCGYNVIMTVDNHLVMTLEF